MTKSNQALPNFCHVPATGIERVDLSDHVGCGPRGRVIVARRDLLSTRSNQKQERNRRQAMAQISCLLLNIVYRNPYESPILYSHRIHPISRFRFSRGSVIFEPLLALNREAK